MKRFGVTIAAAVTIGLASGARAQIEAPVPPFKDVPMTHWAYQAVENLRLKGILRGYPDANFRGKRTITRYELAEALNRVLAMTPRPAKGQSGERGPRGEKGERGPRGEPGPRGQAPPEAAQFRTTLEEMRQELGAVRRQLDAAGRRADSLAGEARDLKKHASPFQADR
jgi:hypothetical protein